MHKKISRFTAILFVLLLASSLLSVLESADAVNPPTPGRWVSSITSYGGYASNPGAIVGSADTNYANMGTPPIQYASAEIVGQMNAAAIGSISVRCCKYSGPESSIMVYAGNTPTGPWIYVGCIRIGDANGNMIWREITTDYEQYEDWGPPPGYAASPFNYIKLLTVTTTPEEPCYIYVDAVCAGAYQYYPPTPPPSTFPITISIQDSSGNPLAGEIYLDGVLIGYTTVTINLPFYYSTGHYYQLYVTVYDQNHSFQYYTTNMGDYADINPVYFIVIYPAGIIAHFT